MVENGFAFVEPLSDARIEWVATIMITKSGRAANLLWTAAKFAEEEWQGFTCIAFTECAIIIVDASCRPEEPKVTA